MNDINLNVMDLYVSGWVFVPLHTLCTILTR